MKRLRKKTNTKFNVECYLEQKAKHAQSFQKKEILLNDCIQVKRKAIIKINGNLISACYFVHFAFLVT